MWGVPRTTHRKFIEPLGGQHAKSKIAANHIGFLMFLARSSKFSVVYTLYRCLYDWRTRTARNTGFVRDTALYRKEHLSRAISWEREQFKKIFIITDGASDTLVQVQVIKDLYANRSLCRIYNDNEDTIIDDDDWSYLRDDICSD